MQTMKLRGTNPALAFAVRRIGLLTSRGWAQHIVDRWRDAVSNRPTAPHTTEIDLAVDEFLSDMPHRGGYYGPIGSMSIWHSLFFLIMLVLYS